MQSSPAMISAADFKKDTDSRFFYYKSLAQKTFAQLSDDELHRRPSPDSNSIAIIVQHLYGNMMSRFTNFLTEDGEKPWRRRDAEFEDMSISRQDLLDFWETGWSQLRSTLAALTDEQLVQYVTIRGEKLRAYDAILRQLAHCAYHVGQIVVIGKMIKDADWQNLSVPKGGSAAFNESLLQGDAKASSLARGNAEDQDSDSGHK